jgi:sulfatase maturation enzyme AslB (radical SAM superfamily)
MIIHKTKLKSRNRLKKKIEYIYELEANPPRKRIDLLIAHRCLFRCKHCFLWKKETHFDSFRLNDWLSVLDDTLKLYGTNVEISLGGDGMALLNGDIIPIIERATQNGFSTLLNTNGYLVNNVILKRLAQAGLKTIVMSLDYVTPERHDKHRGVEGSFEHVMRILDYINEYHYKMGVMFNCVIMRDNLDELLDLVKFVEKLKIAHIYFQAITHPMGVPFLGDMDDSWITSEEYGHLWPEPVKALKVVDGLIELKRQGYRINNDLVQLEAYKNYFISPEKCISGLKCNVMDIGIHIFSEGVTRMCPYKEDVGTLKDGSIIEIMSSQQAKKVNDQMLNCSKNCHQLINCKFRDDSVFNFI